MDAFLIYNAFGVQTQIAMHGYTKDMVSLTNLFLSPRNATLTDRRTLLKRSTDVYQPVLFALYRCSWGPHLKLLWVESFCLRHKVWHGPLISSAARHYFFCHRYKRKAYSDGSARDLDWERYFGWVYAACQLEGECEFKKTHVHLPDVSRFITIAKLALCWF